MESPELTAMHREMRCAEILEEWEKFGGWALFDADGYCLCYRTDSDKTLRDKLAAGMGARIEYRKPFDGSKRPDKYDKRQVEIYMEAAEKIREQYKHKENMKLIDNLLGLYSLLLAGAGIVGQTLIDEGEKQCKYFQKEEKMRIKTRMGYVKNLMTMREEDDETVLKMFGYNGDKFTIYQVWGNIMARFGAYIFDITETDADRFKKVEKYLRTQLTGKVFPLNVIDHFRLK